MFLHNYEVKVNDAVINIADVVNNNCYDWLANYGTHTLVLHDALYYYCDGEARQSLIHESMQTYGDSCICTYCNQMHNP